MYTPRLEPTGNVPARECTAVSARECTMAGRNIESALGEMLDEEATGWHRAPQFTAKQCAHIYMAYVHDQWFSLSHYSRGTDEVLGLVRAFL